MGEYTLIADREDAAIPAANAGWGALAVLREAAELPEASRSVYWEEHISYFSVRDDGSVDGNSVLGSVSQSSGVLKSTAFRVLQWPFRRMGRGYSGFDECVGIGRRIVAAQNRELTDNVFRQILTLSLLQNHIDFGDATDCNLVIGDGYGLMTSLLLHATPHRRTIAANLTKPLLLDLLNVQRTLPGIGLALVADRAEMTSALADPKIRLIAVRADDASAIDVAPVGLAVNNASMQEMTAPVIAEYFRILRGNKARQTAFYCCNKLMKKQGADLISFDDYPWHPEDRILEDSPCPWYQLHYDKTLPFWHYRFSETRTIWHRLALLKMAR